MSQSQNVPPPNNGGIFDSSVKLETGRKSQPSRLHRDFWNTEHILWIEFFTQRRDRLKRGVLNLNRILRRFDSDQLLAVALVATAIFLVLLFRSV